MACWVQCRKKTQVVSFDWPGATDVKMDWSVVEEKPYFKMLEWSFSSKLDWSSYFVSKSTKFTSKKIGALILSLKFCYCGVDVYFYKSTIRPCIEYCCHAWARGTCWT